MIPIRKKSILIILAICTIFIAGYLTIDSYQEKKLVKKAQTEAEIFIEKNFEDINEVAINKDRYNFYPKALGGLSITGYVNGDKNLFFNVSFATKDNKIGKVTSVVKPKEFPAIKEECAKTFCE